jgi:hypothetical protein
LSRAKGDSGFAAFFEDASVIAERPGFEVVPSRDFAMAGASFLGRDNLRGCFGRHSMDFSNAEQAQAGVVSQLPARYACVESARDW